MLKKALSYTFFGGIAAVIDLAVLTLFVEIFGLFYLAAAVISFCVATLAGYEMQRRFTFRSKSEKKVQQIAIFTIVSIVGLGVYIGAMSLGVEVFGLHYFIAAIGAKFAGLAWNFLANHFVTFRI